MGILIDENMSSPRLASRLQAAGHDVVMAGDVGLGSTLDPRVLTWAVSQDRLVLTQDHDDFTDLHELILACGGHHPGILTVRFDNDPHHNLTERGIVTAVGKLVASGVPIPDEVHVLNHWR
jgi:predicted nuclease of predicted toxin-antitoxin system